MPQQQVVQRDKLSRQVRKRLIFQHQDQRQIIWEILTRLNQASQHLFLREFSHLVQVLKVDYHRSLNQINQVMILTQ